jgi:hypothetical protein
MLPIFSLRFVSLALVGVDFAWEQKKLEVRKMFETGGGSHQVRCTLH